MGKLAVRPVRNWRPPAYPTRLDILANPALLHERQPAGWLANAELASIAAALLAVQVGGCRQPLPAAPAIAANSAPPRLAVSATAPVLVAPFFVHGSGRGSTGCVVVTPPHFLSEEEALTVIKDELRQSGIDVTDQYVALGRVSIPREHAHRPMEPGKDGREVELSANAPYLLTIDGYDARRRIGVIYASSTDFDRLGAPWSDRYSSVTDYDLPRAATWIGSQVAVRAEGLALGLFYDPLTVRDFRATWTDYGNRPDWQEYERLRAEKGPGSPEARAAYERARATDAELQRQQEEREVQESQRLLREQVRDFIEWLKGQGMI